MNKGLSNGWTRWVLLLAVAAVIPACHDGGSSGGSSGGGDGSGSWSYANTQNVSNLSESQRGLWDGDVNELDCDEHISVDAAGRLHVTWNESGDDGDNIWYVRSDNGGTTWNKVVKVRRNSFNSNFHLAADASGSAYIAGASNIGFGGDKVVLFWIPSSEAASRMVVIQDGPTTPVPADQVALNNNSGSNVTVLVDAGGIVHVLWDATDDAGFNQLWHRAFNPATGALSVIRRMTSATGPAAGTDGDGSYDYLSDYEALLDGSGNIHAAFLVDTDDSSDDRNNNTDGVAPDGLIDDGDNSADRRAVRFVFKGAGLTGTLAAEQEPMPAAPWTPFTFGAAPLDTTRILRATDYRIEVDNAGRVHLCVQVDRGESGSFTDAGGLDFNTGPDELFYNVRSAGSAGTWGTVDNVSSSWGGSIGGLDLLDDTGDDGQFSCSVDPATGTVFAVWFDRDDAALSTTNLDGNTWYFGYKQRTIGGATFSAQSPTLLDSQRSGTSPNMNVVECSADSAGRLIVVYERESVNNNQDIWAAVVHPTVAFNPALDLRQLISPNQTNHNESDIRCFSSAGGRAIVLYEATDDVWHNDAPYAATLAAGATLWSVPFNVMSETDAANGTPDDGWDTNAFGVAITPNGLYHTFFDTFATHPTAVDSVNDRPDGWDFDGSNDPSYYYDPNEYPDSVDLFHAVSDR